MARLLRSSWTKIYRLWMATSLFEPQRTSPPILWPLRIIDWDSVRHPRDCLNSLLSLLENPGLPCLHPLSTWLLAARMHPTPKATRLLQLDTARSLQRSGSKMPTVSGSRCPSSATRIHSSDIVWLVDLRTRHQIRMKQHLHHPCCPQPMKTMQISHQWWQVPN